MPETRSRKEQRRLQLHTWHAWPFSSARCQSSGSTGGTGSEQRYSDRIISLEPENQSRTESLL
jgi:hypothetical protein